MCNYKDELIIKVIDIKFGRKTIEFIRCIFNRAISIDFFKEYRFFPKYKFGGWTEYFESKLSSHLEVLVT
ncbi:MAG: hypothetical protein H8D97_00325 [Proteobacteria bacterium]|nr:hypothetical protein [Pseudomonadota bacterium]